MVRYAQRPWFSPLGFMASAPTSYGPMMIAVAVILVWPMRYQLSEYFERQRDGPHVELRQKAIKYYNEVERMNRRQALANLESIQDDNMGGRMTAKLSAESLKNGVMDVEYEYWFAHQRDAIRAEKLMLEIQELKAKVAQSAK